MASNKIRTEHEEQREFVSWFRKQYRDKGVRIFAIPNGGTRTPSVACRMKAEGVSRGVPDVFIPEWALWIEFKRSDGGVVSPEQASWIEYLNGCGYTAVVCRGEKEARETVERHEREVVSRWRI